MYNLSYLKNTVVLLLLAELQQTLMVCTKEDAHKGMQWGHLFGSCCSAELLCLFAQSVQRMQKTHTHAHTCLSLFYSDCQRLDATRPSTHGCMKSRDKGLFGTACVCVCVHVYVCVYFSDATHNKKRKNSLLPKSSRSWRQHHTRPHAHVQKNWRRTRWISVLHLVDEYFFSPPH